MTSGSNDLAIEIASSPSLAIFTSRFAFLSFSFKTSANTSSSSMIRILTGLVNSIFLSRPVKPNFLVGVMGSYSLVFSGISFSPVLIFFCGSTGLLSTPVDGLICLTDSASFFTFRTALCSNSFTLSSAACSQFFTSTAALLIFSSTLCSKLFTLSAARCSQPFTPSTTFFTFSSALCSKPFTLSAALFTLSAALCPKSFKPTSAFCSKSFRLLIV